MDTSIEEIEITSGSEVNAPQVLRVTWGPRATSGFAQMVAAGYSQAEVGLLRTQIRNWVAANYQHWALNVPQMRGFHIRYSENAHAQLKANEQVDVFLVEQD